MLDELRSTHSHCTELMQDSEGTNMSVVVLCASVCYIDCVGGPQLFDTVGHVVEKLSPVVSIW